MRRRAAARPAARRVVPALASAAAAAVLALAPAADAAAAPAVPADKPLVLSRWTQADAVSYRAWADAREHRDAWAAYGFDWSTDYCTTSPDNPFGFPFRMACARHDFGYRNHRAGLFPAAKSRLDEAFHADLRRVCAPYSGARRASCESTAWTYYQSVRLFGIS
ncbi:phospholipase [Streptomyces sp. ISL-94]|uniref:phospholipase n=1 Tax=Streptomyces sp. ISL-94 TaxID=2819190 RepID=UPI001BE5ACEA|nr:phospholipase [Streptomyces sp. ISL-94]MBT2481542.1 phospholipase [Streptomyces sp. ISL-94]